jgi:hypothetical protein
MKVGDLAYLNKTMRDLNYPEVGIVVAIEGGRYRIGFPDGSTSIFHPSRLENRPTKKDK